MTKDQKKAVRRALRTAEGERSAAWDRAIRRTRDYYALHDPVCWELLRLRYLDGLPEDRVIERLYIGRTTYYRKESEAMSTAAIFAAQEGALTK